MCIPQHNFVLPTGTWVKCIYDESVRHHLQLCDYYTDCQVQHSKNDALCPRTVYTGFGCAQYTDTVSVYNSRCFVFLMEMSVNTTSFQLAI
jgi:hypothetical protein